MGNLLRKRSNDSTKEHLRPSYVETSDSFTFRRGPSPLHSLREASSRRGGPHHHPYQLPHHPHHLHHPHHHHPHHHHPHLQPDIGFSTTVADVIDRVRHERGRLGGWSSSPSPVGTPSPTRVHYPRPEYGTTSLDQRSRSPSPIDSDSPSTAIQHHLQYHQHSYPVLVTRRGQGRRLPPTPTKPSTLQLRQPSNINFPKLNVSPTHCRPRHSQARPSGGHKPMSYEQAVAYGRRGRYLPSSVPAERRFLPYRQDDSDSDDEEDWC